jgi:group I intron endonuclease
MYTFLVYVLFIPVLVGILLLLNYIFSVTKPDAEKVSSYECGFTGIGDARQPFSVQFYLIAILFLIFDLEILFLFPFAVVLYQSSLTAYWFAVIFFLLLTLGFLYEWSKGSLYFTRPYSNDTPSDSSVIPPRTCKITLWKLFLIVALVVIIYIGSSTPVSSDILGSTALLGLTPVTPWYEMDAKGHSPKFEQEQKGKSGIYVYRRKGAAPNKVYVGSATCLKTRFQSHRRHASAFARGGYTSSPLFDQAVLKYGWDAFEIAVLEYVTIAELRAKELLYLSEQPGYNLMISNNGGVSLEHSPETKAKISESVIGENNPFFGLNHTEEAKVKMSVAKMGVKLKPRTDAQELPREYISRKGSTVYLYSSDSKDLIQTFDSMRQAARHFDIAKTTIKTYAECEKVFMFKYILSFKSKLD